jgi:hypothetical protein
MLKECQTLRAQLVVPEQRQFFDLWFASCDENTQPKRADFKPERIPKLLPGVSLVNVSAQLNNSVVRLAGTKLREVHDREITGLKLCELGWNDKEDYWIAAYRRVVDSGLPAQGVIKGPFLNKEHIIQYWLRLPLWENGRVAMVLGFDHFAVASEETSLPFRASA